MPARWSIFGERDELIKVAHQRIQSQPDLYVNRVWGEHEVGGTSVLYISDVDLGFLTQGAELGSQPMPERTKLAMNVVPFTFVGVVGSLAGLNWIINRRRKVAVEEKESNDG